MGSSCCEQPTLPASPPESVTLRVMKASDVPHVRALHRNLLPVSYPAAFFIQLLVNQRRLCLVATEGGVIVGFASATMGLLQPGSLGSSESPPNRDFSRSPSETPRSHVTLLTLGVLPAYQRKGIGRSLVHGVIQRLEASCGTSALQSYHPSSDGLDDQNNKTAILVQVQVAPSNAAGRCFYTHLGMMDQRMSSDPRLHLGPGSQTSLMAGILCV